MDPLKILRTQLSEIAQPFQTGKKTERSIPSQAQAAAEQNQTLKFLKDAANPLQVNAGQYARYAGAGVLMAAGAAALVITAPISTLTASAGAMLGALAKRMNLTESGGVFGAKMGAAMGSPITVICLHLGNELILSAQKNSSSSETARKIPQEKTSKSESKIESSSAQSQKAANEKILYQSSSEKSIHSKESSQSVKSERSSKPVIPSTESRVFTDKEYAKMGRVELRVMSDRDLHALDLTRINPKQLSMFLEYDGGAGKISKEQIQKLLAVPNSKLDNEAGFALHYELDIRHIEQNPEAVLSADPGLLQEVLNRKIPLPKEIVGELLKQYYTPNSRLADAPGFHDSSLSNLMQLATKEQVNDFIFQYSRNAHLPNLSSVANSWLTQDINKDPAFRKLDAASINILTSVLPPDLLKNWQTLVNIDRLYNGGG